MKEGKELAGHLSALATIILWGTTFIATKVLLRSFTPAEILVIRFVIGYVGLWIVFPRRVPIRAWKEELLFVSAGLSGVTLYFLSENTALAYTLASNVGVIVAIAPLITALLASVFLKEDQLSAQFILGFLLSICGIALIGFNGNWVLKLNPLGDILAVSAAAIWAVYSILMRKISHFGMNAMAATRKVFFYGLLFMVPVAIWSDFQLDEAMLLQPEHLLNFLFLGLGASAVCYVSWNWSVGILGAVKTSVYIYLIPVISVVTAALFLGEVITPVMSAGTLLTLLGLYLSEDKRFNRRKLAAVKTGALK